MCNFSGTLIAWLDHELPVGEASDVERRLKTCSECRSRLDAYERVSNAVAAYCDEAIVPDVRRGTPSWVPAALAGGAVAAVMVLLLASPRAPVKPLVFHLPSAALPSTVVAKALPAPARPVQRIRPPRAVTSERDQDRNTSLVGSQNAYYLTDEGAIQIAIPAEAMFPPGAVPEGINFVGEVMIAADGSAEVLRLRPRLTGFERRTTGP